VVQHHQDFQHQSFVRFQDHPKIMNILENLDIDADHHISNLVAYCKGAPGCHRLFQHKASHRAGYFQRQPHASQHIATCISVHQRASTRTPRSQCGYVRLCSAMFGWLENLAVHVKHVKHVNPSGRNSAQVHASSPVAGAFFQWHMDHMAFGSTMINAAMEEPHYLHLSAGMMVDIWWMCLHRNQIL